jgi:hypothetical protein
MPEAIELRTLDDIEADIRRRLDPTANQLVSLLKLTDGGPQLAERLPQVLAPIQVCTNYENAFRPWELIALYLLNTNRVWDAHAVLWALYDHQLQHQEESRAWFNKATTLLWIAECHRQAGQPLLMQRYLMSALVDDAISSNGPIKPQSTGVLYRLRLYSGMSDSTLQGYAARANEIYKTNRQDGVYPEWILQELDDDWVTTVPSPGEALMYLPNRRYLRKLIDQLGTQEGKALERLGAYMISVMPGCRAKTRQRTANTDYDIVCTVEGAEVDFRSEIGRHFLCECKDWDRPADFTTIAKFVRVLQGTKSRFGIIFAGQGITGEGKLRDAGLEQRDACRELGIVVVVVDRGDLMAVSEGANFIAVLRDKYRRVRLGLQESVR